MPAHSSLASRQASASSKKNAATHPLKPIRYVTRAPERTQPACPYFGPCGGCHYQHADYAAQLRFKQAILRETLERAGVPVPDEIEVLSGKPWAYRNRIRIAFDRNGNPGYRGRRSHNIIPIAECPIAAPILVNAATEFTQLSRTLAPAAGRSELALFCNHDETKLLASIFTAQSTQSHLEKLAFTLQERIPALAGIELVAGRPPQPATAHHCPMGREPHSPTAPPASITASITEHSSR